MVVPTNKKDARTDRNDRIYRTEKAKQKAIVEKIKEARATQQPILVGTISVEKNEELSRYLTEAGIDHEVLNAKNPEREGEIIAQAGRPGSVTLATNMAGRGVDIKLGGVPAEPGAGEAVVAAGGLFVLGTERHESRRIDNQLRGRAARQGDPGGTQFFVSTEDYLMRIFAGERLKSVMTRLNVPEDMPIEQGMITKMLEAAQKKVESHHFDIRKHLLEYDDVLNKHRQVIYERRKNILRLAEEAEETVAESKDEPAAGTLTDPLPQVEIDEETSPAVKEYRSYREMILDMIEAEVEIIVAAHATTEMHTDWNADEIATTVQALFSVTSAEKEEIIARTKRGQTKGDDVAAREELVQYIMELARHSYETVETQVAAAAPTPDEGKKAMQAIEKSVLLRAIDTLWVDHLVAIDHLRTGIGLRGYGQRDPLVEYKRETFHLFNQLQADIQKDVVHSFFKIHLGLQLAPSIMATDRLTLQGAKTGESPNAGGASAKAKADDGSKIGRNDPCYCGSGKKWKKCHGA